MSSNKKNVVMSNLAWRLAERFGAQGVSFVVSIVLARILSPNAYGTVALLTVFITILDVFVDSGLGNALIQKKNADDLDFSTVFYFNVVWCVLLYAIFYLSVPLIAFFYNDSNLVSITRVAGLTILVSGLKNVQQAYVSRQMQFKKFFFATLVGTVFSAIIGITMAYKGFGAWALVVQNLSNITIDTIVLWIVVKWRPKKQFSIVRLKGLFSFGWKILASSLLNTVYNNLRSLIIGKLYSTSELAYYNKGRNWPHLIVTNINSSIDSVLLPAMSAEQDRIERIKNMTRRSIRISTYVMAPMMMGLAAVATPLISLVLTDKWLPSIPFMRIFCITFMFYPIHTSNLNAIKAMGRSDLFLKLEIQKKIAGITLLLTSMWFGVMAMAYSLLISSVASQIINSWPNRKLLGYGYVEQLRDIIPYILLAMFMGVCVNQFELLGFSDVVTLGIQVVAGAFIYIFGSILFKMDSFWYLFDYLKSLVYKRFNK